MLQWCAVVRGAGPAAGRRATAVVCSGAFHPFVVRGPAAASLVWSAFPSSGLLLGYNPRDTFPPAGIRLSLNPGAKVRVLHRGQQARASYLTSTTIEPNPRKSRQKSVQKL